jgi:4'-phosphopantetheinyl transferase
LLQAALGEIHVWRLEFPSLGSTQAGWQVMSDEERARAERFRFLPDCERFCQSRFLLRLVLGEYLGLDPSKVPIVVDEHGKPSVDEIASPRGLQFNLTHSRSMALLALTIGQSIGIDVEDIGGIESTDVTTMAEGICTEHEREAIAKLEQEERTRAFLRCWTRKEALLKAVGVGLLGRLDRFEVPLDCSKRWDIQWRPDSRSKEPTYQMADLSFGDHLAAVAAPVISNSIQIIDLHGQEINPGPMAKRPMTILRQCDDESNVAEAPSP